MNKVSLSEFRRFAEAEHHKELVVGKPQLLALLSIAEAARKPGFCATCTYMAQYPVCTHCATPFPNIRELHKALEGITD